MSPISTGCPICSSTWVDLDFECSTVCPILPGKLAEVAEQLGKIVEHPNQSQPNPGECADGTPWKRQIVIKWHNSKTETYL